MRILLTNDDGIDAAGLRALHAELQQLGDVVVVAPQYEQSGVGLSITYLNPLIAKARVENGSHFGYAVQGSPADCVKLGILEYMADDPPDLVVSGINMGVNVGINVLYSGTVAGAIEAAFFGHAAIAVSQYLSPDPDIDPDYAKSARITVSVIRNLLDANAAPGSIWNLNLPANRPEWPLGLKITRMGTQRIGDKIDKRLDPRGRPYFWSGLDPLRNHEKTPGTDVAEIFNGYATLTPLCFDMTDNGTLDAMNDVQWNI